MGMDQQRVFCRTSILWVQKRQNQSIGFSTIKGFQPSSCFIFSFYAISALNNYFHWCVRLCFIKKVLLILINNSY